MIKLVEPYRIEEEPNIHKVVSQSDFEQLSSISAKQQSLLSQWKGYWLLCECGTPSTIRYYKQYGGKFGIAKVPNRNPHDHDCPLAKSIRDTHAEMVKDRLTASPVTLLDKYQLACQKAGMNEWESSKRLNIRDFSDVVKLSIQQEGEIEFAWGISEYGNLKNTIRDNNRGVLMLLADKIEINERSVIVTEKSGKSFTVDSALWPTGIKNAPLIVFAVLKRTNNTKIKVVEVESGLILNTSQPWLCQCPEQRTLYRILIGVLLKHNSSLKLIADERLGKNGIWVTGEHGSAYINPFETYQEEKHVEAEIFINCPINQLTYEEVKSVIGWVMKCPII